MGELSQIPRAGQICEEEMGKQLQDVLFCSNGGKKILWEFLPFPSFGEQELVAAGGARSSHRPYQNQVHINGLFSIFFFF